MTEIFRNHSEFEDMATESKISKILQNFKNLIQHRIDIYMKEITCNHLEHEDITIESFLEF